MGLRENVRMLNLVLVCFLGDAKNDRTGLPKSKALQNTRFTVQVLASAVTPFLFFHAQEFFEQERSVPVACSGVVCAELFLSKRKKIAVSERL